MRYFLLFIASVILPLCAKTLDVVVGLDKPPYVISANDSGFELELVRAIMADIGHDIAPLYVPFGRTAKFVQPKTVDIGLTLNSSHDIDPELLTDEYVYYQNVVVARTDSHFVINKVSDLAGKSIAAFQTAQRVLGAEYSNILKLSTHYLEMPEQQRQVSMLLSGNIDVAVIDRNIFHYVQHELLEQSHVATVIYPIFPVNVYRAAIPDSQLRNQFNEVLAKFKRDGRYQALLNKYGLANFVGELK